MTPPDPATPSPLEALLNETEALRFQSRLPDPRQLAEGQTRLAAIVRVLRERVAAARAVIRRLPRQEEAGKYCESCGQKSGWDAWERAEKTLDPAGLACADWCPTTAAYAEMAAIDTALRRADEIAEGK